MSNHRLLEYINNNDSFAMRYIKLVDVIEELQIKASNGCAKSKQELEEIQKQINFYEQCRKDRIFRYIAKY